MNTWRTVLWRVLIVTASLCVPAHAQTQAAAQTRGQDTPITALDQRADTLAHSLRCMVCQNQSLADSNAPLAQDMRAIIHQQLQAGKTDHEIMTFFEERYGDFVRYDPPFKPSTWLLWLAPFGLLVAGFAALALNVRRRSARVARAAPSADDRATARHLLDEKTP